MNRKKKDQNNNKDAVNEEPLKAEAQTGQPKQKMALVFLSAFLFMVTVALLFYTFSLKTEVSSLDENLTNCAIELSEVNDSFLQKENRINKLEREIDMFRKGIAGHKTLSDKDIDAFKKKGLDNPVSDIVSSLTGNRQLIPFKGSDGEPMQFVSRDQIYLLSPKMALAEIRDRDFHYGWMLLKYAVVNKDKINWVLMDSYCSLHAN